MNKTCAVLVLLTVGGFSVGCKSREDQQAAAAHAQLVAAQAQAAAAQAQLAQAEKQMAESAAKLGKEGEAAGAAGAALGAQGAALGMQAAAAGMQAATAAMNSLAGSMAAQQPAGKMALVDFRALKALLPESVGDLKRVSASGEKGAAMGLGASHAQGKYRGDGQGRLEIKIVDMAGLGALALAGFGLGAIEVDKESDDGYERTTTLGGNKAFEKYNSKSKHGEVKVLVGSRFIVEIDGHDVPMEAIKGALAKVDLGKLQALGAAAK